MNSRRFTDSPHTEDQTLAHQIVHHIRSRLPMSALGQKQTWRFETAMSAIPPKADMGGRRLDVR
jgi:hypothetical protein